MFKILCVSDFHIEQLEYEKAEQQLFSFLLPETKRISPDLIVICGDLFDNKLQLNSKYTRLMNRLVYELKMLDTYLWIIHGTLYHDNYQIYSYSHYIDEKFLLFSEAKRQKFKNLNMLILPEEYTNNKFEYYKDLVFDNKVKYDFVFGHGAFSHVGFSNKLSKIKRHSIFSYKDFENKVHGLVVFGHDHKRSFYKNIHYIGSFSRFSFGDETPKGFSVFEYDEKKRKIVKTIFVENTLAETYHTVYHNQLDKYKLENQLKDLLSKYDYIKIKIDNKIDDILKNDLFIIVEKEKRLSIQIVTESENKINSLGKKNSFDSKKYEKKHWLDITVEELDKKNKPMKKEEILELINN